jgi:hypothetical protein
MSKTSLTLAAACLALMSVGASAQDSSSYESRGYGGPLGVGPNFHQGGQSAPPVYGSGQERSYSTERYRAPQRLDRVERKRNDADDDVKTAKKTTAPKESEEAKAQNENSSIVSIASDTGKTVPITEQKKTDVAKSDKSKSSNENSAIASVASSATAKADPVKAQVTKADTDGGAKTTATCKRYFPTVGQTITVPCD